MVGASEREGKGNRGDLSKTACVPKKRGCLGDVKVLPNESLSVTGGKSFGKLKKKTSANEMI